MQKYLCQRLRVNPRPGRGREAGWGGGGRGGPLSRWGGGGGLGGGHLPSSPSLGRREGEHTLSRPLGHPATQYSDDDDSNADCDDKDDDSYFDDLTWDNSWIWHLDMNLDVPHIYTNLSKISYIELPCSMLICLDICDLFNGVMLNGGGRVGGKLATKCFFLWKCFFSGDSDIFKIHIISFNPPGLSFERSCIKPRNKISLDSCGAIRIFHINQNHHDPVC